MVQTLIRKMELSDPSLHSPKVLCMHKNLITDEFRGEVFCGNCGQILEEKFEDSGPEFASYTLSDFYQNERTGPPTSLARHDSGLATVIGLYNKDYIGKNISTNAFVNFARLRKWDTRTKSTNIDRNMSKAFTILDSIRNNLSLSYSVTQLAAQIYRKALKEKLTRGRGINQMIGASIYAACRQEGIPRSLTDVAENVNVPRRQLAFAYRLLSRTLKLNIQPYDPISFLAKISNNTGVSEKTKRLAYECLKQLQEKQFFAGKNPLVLCAVVLYIACIKNGEFKSQQQISKVASVTGVSIRNNVKNIMRILGIDRK